MLSGLVAMFRKVTTIVSPPCALSVGPRSPAKEGTHTYYVLGHTVSAFFLSVISVEKVVLSYQRLIKKKKVFSKIKPQTLIYLTTGDGS